MEIIKEMLRIIHEEDNIKKTRLMHKAYIDWKNFNRYFDFLLKDNFIDCTSGDCYRLTENGKDLLRKLEDVDGVLNKNGNFKVFSFIFIYWPVSIIAELVSFDFQTVQSLFL
ncbi:Winged helix-turn-helix [uncultured archaeon]|nr:Winged helix-turn-helix [uncultured archaeon]